MRSSVTLPAPGAPEDTHRSSRSFRALSVPTKLAAAGAGAAPWWWYRLLGPSGQLDQVGKDTGAAVDRRFAAELGDVAAQDFEGNGSHDAGPGHLER